MTPIIALVVGANVGLGLQLVKEILSELHPGLVLATYNCENQAKELLEFASVNKKIRAIQLDAKQESSCYEVAKVIDELTSGIGINLFINTCSLCPKCPESNESLRNETKLVRRSPLLHCIQVNRLVHLHLVRALLPLLEKGSKRNPGPLGINRAAIVNLTLLIGSDNCPEGEYVYRASKAGINQATKDLSHILVDKNILSVALHPGPGKTGADCASFTEDSILGMVHVISNIRESHNGKFLSYNGDELPW